MSPKPTVPAHEQGELLATLHTAQGSEIQGIAPEGVYPSEITTEPGQMTLAAHEAALMRAAQATKNRRHAQARKHTVAPGQLPKPGDALPNPDGVQPVTWTNLHAARAAHAAQQAKQAREAAANPSLFSDLAQHVSPTIAEAGPKEVTAARGGERWWPQLDTLSKRLEVIVDQAIGADFIPATKNEITVALPMVERPNLPGAVHAELMATHDRQMKVTGRKGYNRQVAAWEGRRAVVSRVYEMADYLADAKGSFQLLSELQREVAQTHDLPMIPIRDVFAGSRRATMALRVLARDVLILQLKDRKITEEELGFRPMTAREFRTYKRPELPVLKGDSRQEKAEFFTQRAEVERQVRRRTGAYSDERLLGRDKTLYSPFDPTGYADEKIEAYIEKFMAETTIGELRRTGIAGKLASLQQNRYWHHRRCIADVRGNPYQQVTGPILSKYPVGLVAS